MLIVAGNNNTYNYNNNSHNSNSNNNKQNYKENCNELRKLCRRRARALLRRLKPSSKSQQFCPPSRPPFPLLCLPSRGSSFNATFFLSFPLYTFIYIYIYLGVFVCRHLAKNPFICDCNLRWLADYLHKNPIETSGARCESPKRMHRRRIESLREEKFKCKYAPGRQQQQQ